MKANIFLILLISYCSAWGKTLLACDLSQMDSLEATEALQFLNSCSSAENTYLFHIKSGDTHFRLGQYGQAILNYERARTLNSTDEKLNTNLKQAYKKSETKLSAIYIDEVQKESNLWLNPRCTDILCSLAVLTLLIFLLLAWQWKPSKLKIIAGSAAVVLIFISIINTSHGADKAITLGESTQIFTSPSGINPKGVALEPGNKIEVISTSLDWLKIRTYTGQEGWVKASAVEII